MSNNRRFTFNQNLNDLTDPSRYHQYLNQQHGKNENGLMSLTGESQKQEDESNK